MPPYPTKRPTVLYLTLSYLTLQRPTLSEAVVWFLEVSRHVSELVLENHPAYQTELQRVMELQQTLNSASEICSKGRRSEERGYVIIERLHNCHSLRHLWFKTWFKYLGSGVLVQVSLFKYLCSSSLVEASWFKYCGSSILAQAS